MLELAFIVTDAGIRAPATREPFGWDAASKQVYFAPLNPWIASSGRLGGIDGRTSLAERPKEDISRPATTVRATLATRAQIYLTLLGAAG